jgi:hypothetical protein
MSFFYWIFLGHIFGMDHLNCSGGYVKKTSICSFYAPVFDGRIMVWDCPSFHPSVRMLTCRTITQVCFHVLHGSFWNFNIVGIDDCRLPFYYDYFHFCHYKTLYTCIVKNGVYFNMLYNSSSLLSPILLKF